MRYNNEPSPIRKIAMSLAAGVAAVALFALFFASSYLFLLPQSELNKRSEGLNSSANASLQTSHGHAAFMVFVNGQMLNFSSAAYQNKDIRIHFENGDGSTLHVHDRSAWIGSFLESIGMSLNNSCLRVSNGTSYCSNFDNLITVLVNGSANSGFEHYIPKNGDRILVSYGRHEEIHDQLVRLNTAVIQP